MPPESTAERHDIVAAVIVRDNEVLLCHRHPSRKWYPDVWDLPGGHIESDELPIEALVREMREELGIEIDPSRAVAVFQYSPNPNLDVEVWAVKSWKGNITNTSPDEHDELRWYSLGELDNLELADEFVAIACHRASRILVEPEVAGGLGPQTVMRRDVHPPVVDKLHYVFDGWLGDDIVTSFPCFLVSQRLATAIESSELTGAHFSEVTVSVNPQLETLFPEVVASLPKWLWLRQDSDPTCDFHVDDAAQLFVSQAALDLLRQFNLSHADVT